MIRFFALLVGIAMVGAALFSFVMGATNYFTDPPAETAEHVFHKHAEPLDLPTDGPFGRWDQVQLQRGFKVYSEVCAACHSLSQVAFRNLHDLGYDDAEIDAIAANWPTQQPTFDPKTGERDTRPNVASDHFPKVYYPGQGNPPDLSLIVKAREGGAAYVHSLLTGYQDPPKELLEEFPDAAPGPGAYYNPYFANLNISMPPPIIENSGFTYDDGTQATADQMSKDVAAFLTWTAEPKLVQRKQTGWAVLGFLLVATALGFLAYRQVWSNVKH